MRGDDLAAFPIDGNTPDDVRLLHHILSRQPATGQTINTCNCGTAMRFLTAYFAQKKGCEVVLDGSERMRQRPINQLVEALQSIGAEIEYQCNKDLPPVRIKGRTLAHKAVTLNQPQSTQFVSALMLIGTEVQTDCRSPYIDMTQAIIGSRKSDADIIERDWSAAAFWYEYIALKGGCLHLDGLRHDSLQGDKIIVQIFRHFGVETAFDSTGATVCKSFAADHAPCVVNFQTCPDLYPAVFATCHRLNIPGHFSGLQSLTLKESNRLQAMQQMTTATADAMSYGDHRIAMALTVAGYNVDDTLCISKSYPQFLKQWKMLQS